MGELWRGHAATPPQQAVLSNLRCGRKGRPTQADLLLAMLREARSGGLAVELRQIMMAGIAQHGARLFELRERHFVILNELDHFERGVRSRYRLTFDPERDQ